MSNLTGVRQFGDLDIADSLGTNQSPKENKTQANKSPARSSDANSSGRRSNKGGLLLLVWVEGGMVNVVGR